MTDRTNAERQRRWRERQGQARDDKATMQSVHALFAVYGRLTFPDDISREEWGAFIDREEERRTTTGLCGCGSDHGHPREPREVAK